MRHPISTFVKVILVCLLFAGLSGCGSKKEKQRRIGIAQCSSDPWRWETNDEIERELLFHNDATVEIRSADDIDERQIEDIRYFIDNDFDLIIVNPTRAEAVSPIIKEAYDKGIPVVTFDRRILGESYTAHLEVDNEAIGREAGEYAVSLIPGKANIIEIQGDSSMTPTIRRHKGFAEEIARHPGHRIVASVHGNWNPDTTALIMDSLLDRHPDVDIIYAHSDVMAISAAEVARRKGLGHVKFLGIDGSPKVGIKAVADSVIDATFLYPTYGYTLIRTALAILDGEPYQRETIIPPVSAVDARNADIILSQNEMLREETSKILQLKEKMDDFMSLHSAQTTLLYSFGLIAVLLFGMVFLLLRLFWQRGRHQKALLDKNRQLEEERDKQKILYERLDEATKSKLAFFTNVSHDLRTPLTLIAEPVEQVAASPGLTDRDRSLMKIARKNIAILRRLIDQILDFRKYENGRLELKLSEADFRSLFAEWVESFSALARKRDITLTTEIQRGGIQHLALDVEKIESVVFNLLSNAFKFTPDNGNIRFACSCDQEKLTFSVEDTGCGIPQEEHQKIFDRFYQVDQVRPKGSGIGLALTKAFIELHSGNISLDSQPGKGSRFTVVIPVNHIASATEPPVSTRETQANNTPQQELLADDPDPGFQPVATAPEENRPLILVIDDNSDILRMIEDLLSDEFNILTATNGRQGIKLAARHTPDLIVCDVMMPVMDGLECCRRLKQEVATSHIPVVMLTACAMDQQRIQGYESGADAYLSKPFSREMLVTRIHNLLDNRRRIRDLYANPATTSPKPATPHKETISQPLAIDNDFYAEFLKIANEKMGDRNFGVDAAASLMGLGQSQFTRKIKALTNYTPVELIRNLRLRRARTLLLSTDKTISEIAYEVGFTTPAYFSKCYRDAYGETPSDLRANL